MKTIFFLSLLMMAGCTTRKVLIHEIKQQDVLLAIGGVLIDLAKHQKELERRIDEMEKNMLTINISTATKYPYLFLGEEIDRTPHKCFQCGKWFRTFRTGVSCAVMHYGGCCHYNEEEIETPK